MRSVVVVVVGAWACAARAATPAEDMVTTELLKLLDEEKSLMDDFGRRESFHDIFPAGTGAHLFQDGMGGPPPPPSFHIYKPATWGNIRAHVTSLLFAPKAHKAARGMRCCCHDIHTHCEDVHARATSSADFYKVTKCLADREASVGDLQPACAERIKTTIAGACNSELHSFCAGIEPGNKRLHACLLTNRKHLGNLCRTYIADVIPSDYLVDKSTRAGEPEKKVTVETARTDSPKTAGKAVAEASAKAQKVQKRPRLTSRMCASPP